MRCRRFEQYRRYCRNFQNYRKDANGTKKHVGGDVFDIKITGTNGYVYYNDILDKNDGEYEVVFTPTVIGKLKISNTLKLQ